MSMATAVAMQLFGTSATNFIMNNTCSKPHIKQIISLTYIHCPSTTHNATSTTLRLSLTEYICFTIVYSYINMPHKLSTGTKHPNIQYAYRKTNHKENYTNQTRSTTNLVIIKCFIKFKLKTHK